MKLILFIFDKEINQSISNYTIKYCFKFLFYCFSVNEFLLADQKLSFELDLFYDIIKLGFVLFNGYSYSRMKSDFYIIKTISIILMNFKNQLIIDFCIGFDLFNKIIRQLTQNSSKYLIFEFQQLLGRIFLYEQSIIQVIFCIILINAKILIFQFLSFLIYFKIIL